MIHALGVLAVVAASASPADVEFFESKVRPVLAGACVRCHGPRKASGGLRLDSREAILRGGESGPAVETDRPEESLLLQAVRRVDDVSPMPPDKPLGTGAVADLRRWVAAGAPWPDGAAVVGASRHWAFEPVRAVDPPAGTAGTAVDAFLASAQKSKGLTPAPTADKRTLIRRAAFDLTGLPPTPDEVEAFLADDSPQSYEAVLDRLLASPRYGEKWGRHWLDVARYADTAGETADFPVPDAWRYRNYVIGAMNADAPYDRFLREQIAGDLLARELPADSPPSRYAELVAATGYLAVARRFGFDTSKDQHLTIDDAIDTFGKSVLGLTVACARCHDHKYDPISADDYYALYGIFDSTRYPFPGCEKDRVPRDNPPLVSPAEEARRLEPLRAAVAACERSLAAAERRVERDASRAPASLACGDLANGGGCDVSAAAGAERLLAVAVKPGEMIRLTVSPKSGHGADSTRVELTITERGGAGRVWDFGRDVLHDSRAAWHVWDGSSTPRPLTVFVRDSEGAKGLLCWRGPEPTPCLFANTNARPVAFQTVRLPARSVAVHPGPKGAVVVAWSSPIGGEVSVAGRVEDADGSGGDGVAWSLSVGPGLGEALAGSADAIEALDRAKRALDAFAGSLPRGYAVAEGRPHDARVMVKGDPETLGREVPRRFIDVLGGQAVSSPSGGSGRRDLAGWVADPRNPLTARVIVNRVWQGHFGNGLVRTPDNFGARGEPPTHPELLDWLAARFVGDGWSLKTLHRLIMRSDAYRRSAAVDARNDRIDPDNRALWRFDRRRLTAEEIRDAMLADSGDLDPAPGGPHPFPEPKTWAFTQHNPFTAVYDHNRRGVYLMTQRIKRHPFLALFDGADPSACTGRRDSTTVPTQALFFLNDPFVHARAESLARRLAFLPDDEARLDRACRLLFGRPPRAREAAAAGRFLAEYAAGNAGKPDGGRLQGAWAGWLRVMFSSNEFVYVD